MNCEASAAECSVCVRGAGCYLESNVVVNQDKEMPTPRKFQSCSIRRAFSKAGVVIICKNVSSEDKTTKRQYYL